MNYITNIAKTLCPVFVLVNCLTLDYVYQFCMLLWLIVFVRLRSGTQSPSRVCMRLADCKAIGLVWFGRDSYIASNLTHVQYHHSRPLNIVSIDESWANRKIWTTSNTQKAISQCGKFSVSSWHGNIQKWSKPLIVGNSVWDEWKGARGVWRTLNPMHKVLCQWTIFDTRREYGTIGSSSLAEVSLSMNMTTYLSAKLIQ